MVVRLHLEKLPGDTVAQRYGVVEQGSDLDAFVEIGKH